MDGRVVKATVQLGALVLLIFVAWKVFQPQAQTPPKSIKKHHNKRGVGNIWERSGITAQYGSSGLVQGPPPLVLMNAAAA